MTKQSEPRTVSPEWRRVTGDMPDRQPQQQAAVNHVIVAEIQSEHSGETRFVTICHHEFPARRASEESDPAARQCVECHRQLLRAPLPLSYAAESGSHKIPIKGDGMCRLDQESAAQGEPESSDTSRAKSEPRSNGKPAVGPAKNGNSTASDAAPTRHAGWTP